MTLAGCPPNVRTPRGVREPPGIVVREGSRGNPGRNRTDGARPDTDALPPRTNDAGSGSRTGRCTSQEGALDRPRGPLPTRVQDLPELPEGYLSALDFGLAALDLRLDDGAREAIDGHVRLLLAWTQAINLTAIREPSAVALLHVVDSLTAVPILRARGVSRVLDVGSGGGFPGLTLAAALPGERVLLVDSIAKKVGFLQTVIEATGLGSRVAAEAVRAEALGHDPRDREAWPAVTSRAVAALSELVEVGLPLVEPGGVLVAWKRLPLDEELASAGPALDALRAGRLEVADPEVPGLEDHRLIVVERAGPIDPRFPRDPGERRQRPL